MPAGYIGRGYRRKSSSRRRKRASRAKATRAVDKKQNQRIKKLEGNIEKKFHDYENSQIVDNLLNGTFTPPTTAFINNIYPLITGIIQGKEAESQRIGSKISMDSLSINIVVQASPTPSGETTTKITQSIRLMLVEDKSPTYSLPQTSAATPFVPQYESNLVSWDALLQYPTNGDITPVQMIEFPNYLQKATKRFSVHMDRVVTLTPGATNASRTIRFHKRWKSGKSLNFATVNQGATPGAGNPMIPEVDDGFAPLNSQFYLCYLSDRPITSCPLVYTKARVRYSDA